MRPPRALRTPGRFLPPATDLHSPPSSSPSSFPSGGCRLSPAAPPPVPGRKLLGNGRLWPWGALWRLGTPAGQRVSGQRRSPVLHHTCCPERRRCTPSLEGKTPPAGKTGGDQPSVSDLLPRHPSLQHVPGLGLVFPVSPEQGTSGPRNPLHNQLRISPESRVPAVTGQGAVAGPLGGPGSAPQHHVPFARDSAPPGDQAIRSGQGGRAPALVPGGG